MGRAVSYCKATRDIFDQARPYLSKIPSNYGDSFNKKWEELQKVSQKAEHENKTIYFEKELSLDQLQRPDC